MIECLRDDVGNITAVCEWLSFDETGKLVDGGKILLIAEMEINPSHRGLKTIREFIKRIHQKSPMAEKIFFFREPKYPGRKMSLYTVDKITKSGG